MKSEKVLIPFLLGVLVGHTTINYNSEIITLGQPMTRDWICQKLKEFFGGTYHLKGSSSRYQAGSLLSFQKMLKEVDRYYKYIPGLDNLKGYLEMRINYLQTPKRRTRGKPKRSPYKSQPSHLGDSTALLVNEATSIPQM